MTRSPHASTDRSFTDLAFTDLGVSCDIAAVLAAAGIEDPFPIQAATIPPALSGRDICGRAPTGSGKTLAFAIPVASLVARAEPHRPRALILTPTRELAGQIVDDLAPLAATTSRRVESFYGGTSVRRDITRLRRGVDVAVATPGRLEDLIQRGQVHLDAVSIVVIDEADRMADMGFLPVVKRILDQTHSDRQTLLFSATLDGDVDVLVKRYQNNPVRVEIEESEEEQGQVGHFFWEVDRHDRKQLTADALQRSGSTIVFTRTKRGADRLAKQLGKQGLKTAAIHGNRSQNQRERALSQFASGQVTALVATDVAARGIHVDAVDTVIHYDLPATDKDYVHRSGRTGRAGRDGTVVSLVLEDQAKQLRDLQRGLEHTGTHRVDLGILGGGTPQRQIQRREADAASTSGSPSGGARPRKRRR